MSRLIVHNLLLLTVALAATETASASCGDYLHTKDSKPTNMRDSASRHPVWPGPSRPSTEVSSKDHPVSVPASRCHGPQCRQQNDWPAPFAPPAAEARLLSDAVLFLLPRATDTAPSGSLCVTSEGMTAAGFSGRVERPPRPFA